MDKLFTKYFKKHPQHHSLYKESDIKVVVPVYLEEDDLFDMLKSLKEASRQTSDTIEVILVFNYAETATEDIIKRQMALWELTEQRLAVLQTPNFEITLLKDFNVARKHAGVGHARKAGMDYAAFSFSKVNNIKGIITSIDADCVVEENYFSAITSYFKRDNVEGCNIYFEHPLEGEFSDAIYTAIAEYELHLRYYAQALRFANFPFAFHTVGSCFAVSAEAYLKAGGMPRKQAGEDFYFLQKVIPGGKFVEINETTVKPSSRPSDRVPFGTGPSINALVSDGGEYQTYNLQAFVDLRAFFEVKDQLYCVTESEIEDFTHQLSGRMRSYLVNSDFFIALKPIKDNCSSLEVFKRRFFEVFNAFRVVKYLNYVHAHFLEKTPVFDASVHLYELQYNETLDVFETKELLDIYRKLEKA
ncbi:glycosyltransferase family 2 protein [Carboxylicivirga sp. A043]|uniref:glycosyltransferase n=1 Tax=Carboxylicivirga litoralis TaxID=2816963 RepID=UPI0021CAFC14|nr:glycosyltransferase family A protein [Carboxylicivirga sp. A043]MCU4157197.1 glycosyltransferase family 2 protein [Carboxylicivirga sp. A043]